MRITVGDSGLYCCACVTSFTHQLTPLCVVSAVMFCFSVSVPVVPVYCVMNKVPDDVCDSVV